MERNKVYSITRVRAFISRLPTLEDLKKYYDLKSERELLERISSKVGYAIVSQDPEEYFKELIGRLTFELSHKTEKALGELSSLILRNAYTAFLSRISKVQAKYYTFYGKPIAEDLIKKINSAEDLGKVRTGSYFYDRLLSFPMDMWKATNDVNALYFAFEKVEVLEITKGLRQGLLAEALKDVHDAKVCAFVSNQQLAEELYVSRKLKCKTLEDSISQLSKKYEVTTYENFDDLALKTLYKASVAELSKFTDENVLSLIEILKVYEKYITSIKNVISEKIKVKAFTL